MGGEEFAALLPGTNGRGAMLTAERLCAAIRSAPCVDGETIINITVSVGVTDVRVDDDAEAALTRGDHALYQAKTEGRDRAVGDLLSPERTASPKYGTPSAPYPLASTSNASSLPSV
jgi:diguanylate cyclase (GGDEF)-like protein